jgi:predicted DNA-binding protein
MFRLQGSQSQNVEKVNMLKTSLITSFLMFLMMSIKMMKTLQKLIKNNSKVGAIIIKSVDESVYKDIKDLESAHNMIKKLVEIN